MSEGAGAAGQPASDDREKWARQLRALSALLEHPYTKQFGHTSADGAIGGWPVYPAEAWDGLGAVAPMMSLVLAARGVEPRRVDDLLSEGRTYRAADPRGLDADELMTGVYALIRSERFCEGSIGGALSSGWAKAAVDRALELAEEAGVIPQEA